MSPSVCPRELNRLFLDCACPICISIKSLEVFSLNNGQFLDTYIFNSFQALIWFLILKNNLYDIMCQLRFSFGGKQRKWVWDICNFKIKIIDYFIKCLIFRHEQMVLSSANDTLKDIQFTNPQLLLVIVFQC